MTQDTAMRGEKIYEFDLDSGERTLLKQDPVRGGHDPSAYVSERLFARAPDGKRGQGRPVRAK